MCQDGKQDSFEFDSSGELISYISLDEASIPVMRVARETPGDYGRHSRSAVMEYEIVEARETEYHYIVFPS